jgi:hypothetical protein
VKTIARSICAETPSGQESSSQVELKTQSVSDFLNAPLKENLITGTRIYRWLPAKGMVSANADFDFLNAERRHDHVG